MLGVAQAQRSFDPDHMQLALTRSPFFALEGAGEIPRWDYRAGFSYGFIQSPLVLERQGVRTEAIRDRSVMQVGGAVQFGRWVGVGVSLPLVLADRGTKDIEHGGTIGDIRLVPRVEILHRGRFGLAGLLNLRIPSGARDRLVGEGMVVFEPRFAFQVKINDWVDLGTNLGFRVRQARNLYDLDVTHEMFLHVAVAVTPRPYVSAVAELHGDTALSARFGQRTYSPLEMLFGVFGQWRWLRGGLAAGFGLNEGWGAPRARVFATLEYRRWDKPKPALPPDARPMLVPPPKDDGKPDPVPDPTAEEPESDPEPEVTPEEPDVAVHRGRIELATPIFFAKDRKRVRHQFLPELQQLARVLNRRTELTTIWIEGHADATGPERWNLQLSRWRAEAVAHVLIQYGVKAERLKPVGFGEARPLVPAKRGESNEKNRRVHFFTDKAPDTLPAGVESGQPAPKSDEIKFEPAEVTR